MSGPMTADEVKSLQARLHLRSANDLALDLTEAADRGLQIVGKVPKERQPIFDPRQKLSRLQCRLLAASNGLTCVTRG